MKKLARFFLLVEEWLLIILVVVLTGFAVLQIVLRNFFSTGITWGDTLLRHMVLWIGFLGASRATAENKHIRIELIPLILPPKANLLIAIIRGIFLIVVSAALFYASLSFLRYERLAADIAFRNIPYWWFEIIFPFTFAVMTIRFAQRLISETREPGREEK